MKPKTSQRWLVSLLLVNLLIGIVIGILLDQYFLTPAEARPDAHNKRPTGIQGLKPPKPRMLEKLGQMLDLSDEQHAALSVLVGQELSLKVIEVNRRRQRAILSERMASQEQREEQRAQLMSQLEQGSVRRGRVTGVREFGAFVPEYSFLVG